MAQTIVALGSAANFAVLAGSGITVAGTAGSTRITGDIGTAPTATIAGFENVLLAGVNHAGDATTLAAQTDLATAYADAAGRTGATTFAAIHDLAPLAATLGPGVYNDPTSFAITGILTLNAGGNADAVWIFQAGSTLITATNSQVVLTNGARAENVFWQVGSSATLGTSSLFAGSILAHDSITLETGASVDGRLLALGAHVTLLNNTVTAVPEPAATSLLIAGLLGLIIGARRIRRHHHPVT
jgi:hypothetical protein